MHTLKTIRRVVLVGLAAVIAETGIVGVPQSVFSQVHFLAQHNGEWGFRAVAVLLAVGLLLLAIAPDRASAWWYHLKGEKAQTKEWAEVEHVRPQTPGFKPLPGAPRKTDPVWEALTAVMHSGSAVLARLDRGEVTNIFEEGGNWASSARDEIEALTDPTEAVLFDQTRGNPDDQIRTKVEYIRDRLLPKAREGYWPFDAVAVERRRQASAHERTKTELGAFREREQQRENRTRAAAKATKASAPTPAVVQSEHRQGLRDLLTGAISALEQDRQYDYDEESPVAHTHRDMFTAHFPSVAERLESWNMALYDRDEPIGALGNRITRETQEHGFNDWPYWRNEVGAAAIDVTLARLRNAVPAQQLASLITWERTLDGLGPTLRANNHRIATSQHDDERTLDRAESAVAELLAQIQSWDEVQAISEAGRRYVLDTDKQNLLIELRKLRKIESLYASDACEICRGNRGDLG
jgi:hypothetical protein